MPETLKFTQDNGNPSVREDEKKTKGDSTEKPETRHTLKRKYLALKIKGGRRFPFEKRGARALSQREATALGVPASIDKPEVSIGRSTLKMAEVELGVDLVNEVKRLHKKINLGQERKSQRPVRILDVGAGTSTVLAELKKRFGRELEAHSVDIRFLPPDRFPQKRGVEQHVFHVESLSRTLPEGCFDIVIDKRGGVLYAVDRERALTEIFKVLAPGGEAFIYPKPVRNIRNLFKPAWIQSWAERNAAKVEFLERKEDIRIAGVLRIPKTLKITKPLETRAVDTPH